MARCRDTRFSARPIKENAVMHDARAQKQPIEFLRTDLELAQIFVDSARQQLKMGELEDYAKLLRQTAKVKILSITLVTKSPISGSPA
jgi:hypothetical protein